MLLSMTGFGSELVILDLPQSGKIAFSIEIKTINSRFFEAVCKLPGALSSLEITIGRLLQKKLLRGRVYLTIRFLEDNEALEALAPSLHNVKSYVAAVEAIQKAYHIAGQLTVSDLVDLPNVFVAKKSELSAQDEQVICQKIRTIIDKVIKTRLEEGHALQQDLQKRFILCKQKIEKIHTLTREVMATLKEKINQKLVLVEGGDELAKLQLDDLYSALNKVDVHEEIIRATSHLDSIERLFEHEDLAKGKRLDFILQELLREINTTMAKCSQFDISSACVDIKVELEKAREQSQNIV